MRKQNPSSNIARLRNHETKKTTSTNVSPLKVIVTRNMTPLMDMQSNTNKYIKDELSVRYHSNFAEQYGTNNTNLYQTNKNSISPSKYNTNTVHRVLNKELQQRKNTYLKLYQTKKEVAQINPVKWKVNSGKPANKKDLYVKVESVCPTPKNKPIDIKSALQTVNDVRERSVKNQNPSKLTKNTFNFAKKHKKPDKSNSKDVQNKNHTNFAFDSTSDNTSKKVNQELLGCTKKVNNSFNELVNSQDFELEDRLNAELMKKNKANIGDILKNVSDKVDQSNTDNRVNSSKKRKLEQTNQSKSKKHRQRNSKDKEFLGSNTSLVNLSMNSDKLSYCTESEEINFSFNNNQDLFPTDTNSTNKNIFEICPDNTEFSFKICAQNQLVSLISETKGNVRKVEDSRIPAGLILKRGNLKDIDSIQTIADSNAYSELSSRKDQGPHILFAQSDEQITKLQIGK